MSQGVTIELICARDCLQPRLSADRPHLVFRHQSRRGIVDGTEPELDLVISSRKQRRPTRWAKVSAATSRPATPRPSFTGYDSLLSPPNSKIGESRAGVFSAGLAMAQADTQWFAFDLVADSSAVAPTRKFHEHSPPPLGLNRRRS
jgi:hypothetical protein